MNVPQQTQQTQQPQQVQQPNTQKTFVPNQPVVNPADGKSYTVVQQNPGKGVVVKDPQTQQQLAVPETDVQNLQPALRTSALEIALERALCKKAGTWAVPQSEEEARRLISYLTALPENVKLNVNEVEAVLYNLVGDDKLFDTLDSFEAEGIDKETVVTAVKNVLKEWFSSEIKWKEPWNDKALKLLKEYTGVVDSNISISSLADNVLNELIGESLPVVTTNKKAEDFKMRTKRWHETRKELKKAFFQKKEIDTTPTYNEPRQVRAMRELGIVQEGKATKPDIDETGHDRKTGLPYAEKKDIEVGLTEFPKDTDKAKNPEGYGAMTFEQMDHKFEDEREHFDNESKLPANVMMREESDDYYTGDRKRKKIKEMRAESEEPRYSRPQSNTYKSNPKNAAIDVELDNILGIKEAADIEEDIIKKPVQYKDIKKAPGSDMGFTEPEVIPEAKGDVKEAIEMLKTTQKEIADLQEKIKIVSKPLQEALTNATKPLNDELMTKNGLISAYLSTLYEELYNTDQKIAYLEDAIYAALSREQATAPSASLAEILQKAEITNPKVAEEIRKIKSLVENEKTKMILEQFLYRYPVSEKQKKKLGAVIDINTFIDEVISAIKSLQQLNSMF